MFIRRSWKGARGRGPMAKSEISPSLNEKRAGLALATLPCPVAAACPMRARARAMRRGHRVSVAKGRPDRNAGGEGRLRGRDGGACSECRVNNFHLRGCSRPCRKRRRKMRKRRGEGATLEAPRARENKQEKKKARTRRRAGGGSAVMAPVI